MSIYPEYALEAYKELGSCLGMDEYEASVSVVRIANSIMSKILRIVSVERGYDPRDFSLVAFGGAGPMHVCALAEELKVDRVLLPPNPGMFSALGLLTADLFHDYSSPVLALSGDVDPDVVEELFRKMEGTGHETLELEGVPEEKRRFQRTLDIRYMGQGFELNVETEGKFTAEFISKIVKAFHSKHNEVYGYMDKNEPVEFVNAKLRVIGLLDTPSLPEKERDGDSEPSGLRKVFFESVDDWEDTAIYNRKDLGRKVEGPAIVEQYDSTTVVYPGWSLEQDRLGVMTLRRRGK
jgi:N-methylhydantoinase A